MWPHGEFVVVVDFFFFDWLGFFFALFCSN